MSELEQLVHAKIPGPETGIEVRHTMCDICTPGPQCGVDAYIKDGVVIKVEGTAGFPTNNGALCTKGAANRQYIYRKDRIRTPMRRTGPRGSGKVESISWDEAVAAVAMGLNGVKARHGAEAVAFMTGYPKWYRPFLHRLAYSFGSPNYLTESSTCHRSEVMSWQLTYGSEMRPDVLGMPEVLVGWACNPLVSAYPMGRNYYQYKEKGGRVVIIDPRRTPTAVQCADLYIRPRVGTDGYLANTVARLIIENGWADMKNYIQILDAGFEEIKIGVLPATADQVMIGDITRSRLESVKVLFFTGVNEGIVPQRKAGGSLLNDGDREVFKSLHMELAPTAREEGCIQKFYLYLMLSKPSRQLVITYAAMNGQGKSCHPSSLIGEIRRLFPEMVPREKREEEWPVWTAEDGLKKLMAGLRGAGDKNLEQLKEAQGTFLELFRRFYGQEEYRKLVEKLTDAAFFVYEDKGIGRAAARALYGQKLQGSVTRLEQFAACAYAHFLKYGLELMERQEYQLEAVDMGNLFHQSLDQCFEVIHENGMDWSNITEEERKELVKKCVDQVTSQYGNTIMSSSARNTYLAKRVERITDRTIWALAEQVKKGDFVPSGFEVSFSAIDNLKAMKIRLSEDEELLLKGRIDRLDLCEDEKHVYVKIIDYKSGNTSFDLAALYYGLQLQLVVYMDAALEMEERKNPEKTAVPAGIFYYNIKDPMIKKEGEMTPEEIEKQILKQLRMNGLVNSDLEVIHHLDREIQKESDVIPVAVKDGYVQEAKSSVAGEARFQALRRFVGKRLKQSGQAILKGENGLAPYKDGDRTACDYCPYHAVCGFDTKPAGYGFRRLRSMKPEEVWQEIEEKGGMKEDKNGEGDE